VKALNWLKRDIKKHWLSWTGFIILGILGIAMFFAVKAGSNQLIETICILAMGLFWGYIGLYLEVEYEKRICNRSGK